MKCDQVKAVIGLYLDSELDGRSAQEVRAHLEQCPDCAALYRDEQAFDEALRARLKPSAPTAPLWKREEALVAEAFARRAQGEARTGQRIRVLAPRTSFWREFLWPAPSYYAGLAVVWLLLLLFRPAQPETAGHPVTVRSQMSPQARFALLEQRRELKQMLANPETAPEEPREKAAPPHSERAVARREA